MLGPFYQYTEDDISRLLRDSLSEPRFEIFDHILLNNGAMLQDSIRRAIEVAFEGRIAVLPINIDNNHWVGAIIRLHEGRIQLIYNDPLGLALGFRPNAELLINQLRMIDTRMIDTDAEIIDLGIRQQDNPYDCGPLVVNNLVLLAQQRTEANIDEMRASLLETDVALLRETHALTLLGHITVDYAESGRLIENQHIDIATPTQELPEGNTGILCCCMIVTAIVIVGVVGVVSIINEHS
jgi:hypothetical protein